VDINILFACFYNTDYFYLQLGNNGSDFTEEELDTHTISAWKEGKSYLNRQIDGHVRALPRHLIHVSDLSGMLVSVACKRPPNLFFAIHASSGV
jgi:hypothetical protein